MNKHPEIREFTRLVVVGDGPLYAELERLAASLGVADVTWLPGARIDVEQQLQLFDLFVLTSLNEGISNTILEAMATGLPIVATDVGGNPELLAGGQCGTLVPPSDVDRLSNALLHYVRSPRLAEASGRAARVRVESRFSLDAMLGGYAELYGQMLSTKPKSASGTGPEKSLAS